MPQLVETILKDGTMHRIWWENHKFRITDTFVYNVPEEPLYATLDPDAQTMDIDYRNNYKGTDSHWQIVFDPLFLNFFSSTDIFLDLTLDYSAMPNETMFYRPGMRYFPRNRYVVQYHPTLHYLDKDGFLELIIRPFLVTIQFTPNNTAGQ